MKKFIKLLPVIATIFLLSCEKEVPKASFTIPLDSEGNEYFVIGENLEFINTSENADEYEWYFGDGGKSTAENPTYSFSSAGSYYVSLIASNKDGRGQAIGAVFIYNSLLYITTKDDRNGNVLDSVLVIVFDNYSDYESLNLSNTITWGYTDQDGEIAFTNLALSKPYYFYARKDIGSGTYFSNYNYNDYLNGLTSRRTSLDIKLQYYEPFISTFYNNTYTPITITINSVTQTIPVEGSVSFSFNSNPGSYTYTAYTYGETSSGTRVGEYVSWENTHNVSSLTSKETYLSIDNTMSYIYVQNYGTASLRNFKVNYGSAYETIDYISIPADNNIYATGYYYAIDGGEIRADLGYTGFYVYWIENTHFYYPNLWNQYVLLKNSNKSAQMEIKDFDQEINSDAPTALKADRIIQIPDNKSEMNVEYGIIKRNP
ncbi:MAG: PKD domain-containing protein [Bacteroidales bacterium]|nr:PKD domain-containing protein [Bacteroidales bacterium]